MDSKKNQDKNDYFIEMTKNGFDFKTGESFNQEQDIQDEENKHYDEEEALIESDWKNEFPEPTDFCPECGIMSPESPCICFGEEN